MAVSLKSEPVLTDNDDEEHMEDKSGDEMIVCTVPWQKQIILMPSDFTDYDAVNYDTVIEVNLKKYNSNAYLPKSYTTITPVKFHSNHNDKLQET